MLQGTNILVINVILVVVILVVNNAILVLVIAILLAIVQGSGKDGWVPGVDQSASTAPQ